MRLTDELNKQREHFLAAAPQEVIELMGTATQQLRDSGIEKSSLQVGEKAPAITLQDTDNSSVELYDALEAGPVILKFFRGHW
jgi:hypothetical protein